MGFTQPAVGTGHAGLLLVCEGMPDALTAAQAGYRAVGLLGAHTPDDTVAARIANHATNRDAALVIIADPDPAGRRLTDTLAPLLAARGHKPAVITPPDGQDLNAWGLATPDWHHTLQTVDATAVTPGVEVEL